jgi:hypothetical protein
VPHKRGNERCGVTYVIFIETMRFASMSSHAFVAGAEIPTSIGFAAIARNDRQRIDCWYDMLGDGHLIWLEQAKLGDGRQQTLSLLAVYLVPEQVALNCALLDGVFAIPADQDAIARVVFEEVVGAESNWRHGVCSSDPQGASSRAMR